MVNFKAGGHQGEHKRALASQDAPESHHVSKEEKLSMGRDGTKQAVNVEGIALKVVAREKVMTETNGLVKVALVDAETLARRGGPGYTCRPGGDHVLSMRVHDSVAEPGTILLSEAQRLSLHVCEDEIYEWVPFAPDEEAPILADLSLEVQLLEPREGEPLEVDAGELSKMAGKLFFDELVSSNELFIASHRETKLVLRVTDVNMVLEDDGTALLGFEPSESATHGTLIVATSDASVCAPWRQTAPWRRIASAVSLTLRRGSTSLARPLSTRTAGPSRACGSSTPLCGRPCRRGTASMS